MNEELIEMRLWPDGSMDNPEDESVEELIMRGSSDDFETVFITEEEYLRLFN